MVDVFISYSRSDQAMVAMLARAVEAEGYDVRRVEGGAPCGAPATSRIELSTGEPADLGLIESVGQEGRCVLAIRGGSIVFDSAGLAIPDVTRAGPYSNFK